MTVGVGGVHHQDEEPRQHRLELERGGQEDVDGPHRPRRVIIFGNSQLSYDRIFSAEAITNFPQR